MNKLTYLKSFNDFTPYMLNESLGDAGQKAINRAFLNMGDIKLSNGDVIKPKDIVKVVDEAVSWVAEEFRTYYSFAKDCNIIYMINNPDCQTMCVDQYMNIFMDVLFIYNNLKMNPLYVATIIMHEIFHVIYNHIERGKNWLSANGRPITDFRDTNLAGDVEVNSTLINKGIIDQSTLVNELHGLYLPKKNGDRTNLPMEMILENEKLMEKLRAMVDGPKDTREHIKTSDEWDDGYKTGWDKIAELIDKYGAEETMKKLQEAGICNNNGDFNEDVDEDKIMGLNFLTIKLFSQFMFENKNSDMFKSYDDGFISGVRKAISLLKDSLFNGDDNDDTGDSSQNGQTQNNNTVPDSNLKPKDLKKLNLPKRDKQNQKGGNGFSDNLPTNTDDNQNGGGSGQQNNKPQSQSGDMNQPDENDDKSDDSQSSQSSNNQNGSQGQEQNGKSSQNNNGSQSNQQEGDKSQSNSKGGSGSESGSGDVNQLANDLKDKKNKKSQGGNPSYADKPKGKSTQDDNSVGNTGSFINDPDSSFAKKALKDSGYSDDNIENIINDTIEKNKRLNTPEGIKEKRKKLYSKLSPSDPVKKLLDDIEISESKFQNIWKKIMKQFLGQNCRRAGKDKMSKDFDWKNKRAIVLAKYAPNFHKEKQEPQNINIYVDVSGSVNKELLEVIAKSLSIFCNQYEYTGINIIPWASQSNGIHEVESVKKSSPEKVAKEILGYISQGVDECGGGTDLIRAFLPELISISNDKKRTKKDDKHIIITDGETGNDESKIESLISKHCGAIVNKNCFWMIYDAYSEIKENWEKSIKIGTLLFINSKIVIGNE